VNSQLKHLELVELEKVVEELKLELRKCRQNAVEMTIQITTTICC
jgi:ribosomal protein L29